MFLDFVYGSENNIKALANAGKIIGIGIVNGRNVWVNDIEKSVEFLKGIAEGIDSDKIMVGSSCSLLHVPYTLKYETKMDEDIDICGFQTNLHSRIENFVNGVVLQDILDKHEEMVNAQVQDLCTLLNELWVILTDYKQRFEDVIKQAMEDFNQLVDEVVSKLAQMIPLVSVPIPQIDDPCGLYNAGLEETMAYIDSVGKNVVNKIKAANSTDPSVLSKIVMESVSDEYNTKSRIDNIIARLQ
jgi:hypothetical protein